MMNTLFSSQQPNSPPSNGCEFENCTFLDSSNDQAVPPPIFGGGAASLPQKRKAGRKKFKETRHPIFRGVRERDGGKWVCEVREPNKKSRIWLGTYPTAQLAARAHDVAALALRGDKATLNFPDSAWLAPRAKSTSARDIRLAALQATRFDLRSSSPREGGYYYYNKREEKEECSTCTSYGMEYLEKGVKEEEDDDYAKELFLDEEAIFNMPLLIDGMAAGMLLTPPSLKKGIFWGDSDDDDYETNFIDLDLW